MKGEHEMLDKTITIPTEQFDRLVKIEARVNVLLDNVERGEYMYGEKILKILDTDRSQALYQKIIEKKEEEERKKRLKESEKSE